MCNWHCEEKFLDHSVLANARRGKCSFSLMKTSLLSLKRFLNFNSVSGGILILLCAWFAASRIKNSLERTISKCKEVQYKGKITKKKHRVSDWAKFPRYKISPNLTLAKHSLKIQVLRKTLNKKRYDGPLEYFRPFLINQLDDHGQCWHCRGLKPRYIVF